MSYEADRAVWGMIGRAKSFAAKVYRKLAG